MFKLPKFNEAIVPIEKFTHYCLNPEADADKTVAFNKALGYNIDNASELIANIRRNLPNYPATPKGDAGYGMKYEIVMSLKGPNGKTANVLTAWIDDKNTGEMRLINAYVDRRRATDDT